MGHVAKTAGAGLERRMRLAPFERGEHFVMTIEAELILGLDQERLRSRRVRAVAARALPVHDRSMDNGLVELFSFIRMARVAKRLCRHREKPGLVRTVRVVARRALLGRKGIVQRRPLQIGPLIRMTREANISARRGRKQASIG